MDNILLSLSKTRQGIQVSFTKTITTVTAAIKTTAALPEVDDSGTLNTDRIGLPEWITLKWRRDQIYKAPPESAYHIELLDEDDSGTLNTDRGQGQSVGTIDPDYQTHYPGTVSSAGGTIGSRTCHSRFSSGDSILTPSDNTFGTQSIYTNENDDQSFQNHLCSATD